MDSEQLGTNIREARKMIGLTQTELAQKAEISVMSIRRYESGERLPTLELLEKIATFLGTSANFLLPPDNYWVDAKGIEYIEPQVVLPPDIVLHHSGSPTFLRDDGLHNYDDEGMEHITPISDEERQKIIAWMDVTKGLSHVQVQALIDLAKTMNSNHEL